MAEQGAPEQLRQAFLKHHKEWEAANRPEGYEDGSVHAAWEKRTDALIALVQAEQKAKG